MDKSNNNDPLLAQALKELQELRKDVYMIHRTLARIESSTDQENTRAIRPRPFNTAQSRNVPVTVPPIRRPLNENIAQPPNNFCFYHRRHGLRATSERCPGLPLCSWNQAEELEKMKSIIAKLSMPRSSVQQRITKARSTAPSAKLPDQKNQANQVAAPSISPIPMHIATSPIDETLENDLLMSDSD